MSSEIKQTQAAIRGYTEAHRFVEETRNTPNYPDAQAVLDEANFELMEAKAVLASSFEALNAVLHRRPETEVPDDIVEFAKTQATEEAAELLETIKLAKEIHAERTAQLEVARD